MNTITTSDQLLNCCQYGSCLWIDVEPRLCLSIMWYTCTCSFSWLVYFSVFTPVLLEAILQQNEVPKVNTTIIFTGVWFILVPERYHFITSTSFNDHRDQYNYKKSDCFILKNSPAFRKADNRNQVLMIIRGIFL